MRSVSVKAGSCLISRRPPLRQLARLLLGNRRDRGLGRQIVRVEKGKMPERRLLAGLVSRARIAGRGSRRAWRSLISLRVRGQRRERMKSRRNEFLNRRTGTDQANQGTMRRIRIPEMTQGYLEIVGIAKRIRRKIQILSRRKKALAEVV